MIRRSGVVFFIILVVCGLCLAAADLAAQSVHVAEVIYISGSVQIKTGMAPDWLDAQAGMTVKEGDIIRTGGGSEAELAFGEGLNNIIKLFAHSQLVITAFEPGLVKLDSGRVFSLIKGLKKGSHFEVRTPTAVCGARGTGWETGFEGGVSDAAGYEETVYVAGLGEREEFLGLTDMKAGLKTRVSRGGGPGEFLRLGDEELSLWRSWRDEARARVREYKKKRRAVEGVLEPEEDKLRRAEHRSKILERVERETTRSEEIKRERRTQGGTSEHRSGSTAQ